MADLIEFPKKVAGKAGNVLVEPLRHWPAHSVDDFGRDPHLIGALSPLAKLRWDVGVGGVQHLPTRGGALLVCNSRRWALSSVFAALALSEATGRPVRFVGRPDIVPLGPFMRRIGGLLARPDEVLGALRHHELVLVSCEPTGNARHAGKIDPHLLAPAVVANAPVFPSKTNRTRTGMYRWNTGAPATTAGASRWGSMSPAWRAWPVFARDEHEFVVAQRAEHLVGPGEQPTDAAHERPERGDVGATDEPDRADRWPR